MLEGRGGVDSLEAAGYAEFSATGQPAVGEYQCSDCGYGITVGHKLPRCPMCGGTAWEQASGRGPLH